MASDQEFASLLNVSNYSCEVMLMDFAGGVVPSANFVTCVEEL